MSIRAIGGGEAVGNLIETEAVPLNTYRVTNPAVGDFVLLQPSALNMGVNSMAASASLMNAPHPWGLVTEVNKDSSILTVRWMNVRGFVTFQYSGTATVGLGLQGVATAGNNKVSCVATLATTTTPKPFVVATDVPTSGYLMAAVF
jgi:hypothetical protein